MTLEVKFVCSQCWERYYKHYEWDAMHQWKDLGSAMKHLSENPDHHISAETEIEIHL